MASRHLPLCQDVVAQEELRKFKEEATKQDKIHSKLAKTIINDIVQSTFDELAKGEHDGPYWDFLARSQNELVESAEKLTARLTFADVQVDQVQRWFQLTLEKLSAPRDWQGPHEEVQIPQCAVDTLAMIDRGMARAETMNEAAVRCRLNIVLFSALDIVMQTPLDGRWPLSLQTETPLVSRPFRFRGKSHQTHGICDYTLWYGDQSISKAINLIIVEAKKKGSCDSGIAQCLGYMATVHQERKASRPCRSTTVYGVATDSYKFTFLRINQKSEWAEFTINTNQGERYDEVMSMLAFIMREAISLSPCSSRMASKDVSMEEFP